MTTLRVPFEELAAHSREREWQNHGASNSDIRFAHETGIDARDVRALREFSSRRFLLVVRCPKRSARVWHGVMPPKPMAIKQTTGTSGAVVLKTHRMFVSDYDLMSVWRIRPDALEKVFVSAVNGRARGPWLREAAAIVIELNKLLVSRIQHGCQDDFHSPDNPGVKPIDHFAVFRDGATRHLRDPAACAQYYHDNGIDWPYGKDGKYHGIGA